MKRIIVFNIVAIILLVGLSFCLGVLVESNLNQFKSLFGEAMPKTCSNLSFDDSVMCLNNDFNSWYHFNISQVNKELTIEQLKNEGGVCSQAAEWYANSAKDLGFNATTSILRVSSTIAHRTAILYNNDLSRYCVLDQGNVVGCMNLKTGGILNETK